MSFVNPSPKASPETLTVTEDDFTEALSSCLTGVEVTNFAPPSKVTEVRVVFLPEQREELFTYLLGIENLETQKLLAGKTAVQVFAFQTLVRNLLKLIRLMNFEDQKTDLRIVAEHVLNNIHKSEEGLHNCPSPRYTYATKVNIVSHMPVIAGNTRDIQDDL